MGQSGRTSEEGSVLGWWTEVGWFALDWINTIHDTILANSIATTLTIKRQHIHYAPSALPSALKACLLDNAKLRLSPGIVINLFYHEKLLLHTQVEISKSYNVTLSLVVVALDLTPSHIMALEKYERFLSEFRFSTPDCCSGELSVSLFDTCPRLVANHCGVDNVSAGITEHTEVLLVKHHVKASVSPISTKVPT